MNPLEMPNNEIQAKQQSSLALVQLTTQIENITKALKMAEEDREKEANIAIDTKNKNTIDESKRHLKQTVLFKKLIEHLDKNLTC